jgi:hypothetical protein
MAAPVLLHCSVPGVEPAPDVPAMPAAMVLVSQRTTDAWQQLCVVGSSFWVKDHVLYGHLAGCCSS